MDPDAITEEQMFLLVAAVDAQLLNAGMDVKRRALEVPRYLMKQFGLVPYTIGETAPPAFKRVRTAFEKIYRKGDIAIGGPIGVFMFRDVFIRVSVPEIFGKVKINPFNFAEFSEGQKIIMQAEPEMIETYLDQFVDLMDIHYRAGRAKPQIASIELASRFIERARLHLHAAAAVLTGGYDHRGAVQSALLAIELALKVAPAADQMTEDQIRQRFSHKLASLLDYAENAWPSFDTDRVRRLLDTLPNYVSNRYQQNEPSRIQIGHTVMRAQYVVAEMLRQVASSGINLDLQRPRRLYPP